MKKLVIGFCIFFLLFAGFGCATLKEILKQKNENKTEATEEEAEAEQEEIEVKKEKDGEVFDVSVRPRGRRKVPDILSTRIDRKRYPLKWSVLNKFGTPDAQDLNYFTDETGKEWELEIWYFGNVVVEFKNGQLMSIRTLNPTKIDELKPEPKEEN